MNVEDIYSPNIVSAPRSHTLEQAAILMRDRHVGALLITDDEDDRAVGVVTDRDLVLLAMAQGMDPCDSTVGEVMTPSLITVDLEDPLSEAMGKMRDNGVRRLGVTDETGRLVGVLSMDDIVAGLGSELGALADIVLTGQEHELIKR